METIFSITMPETFIEKYTINGKIRLNKENGCNENPNSLLRMRKMVLVENIGNRSLENYSAKSA